MILQLWIWRIGRLFDQQGNGGGGGDDGDGDDCPIDYV
jgi:hypothetical protein